MFETWLKINKNEKYSLWKFPLKIDTYFQGLGISEEVPNSEVIIVFLEKKGHADKDK